VTPIGQSITAAIERLRRASEASGWEREDARVRAELSAVERAQRADRLRRAGIALPPAERQALIAGALDLSRTHAGRFVQAWHERGHAYPVLVLQGPPGVGKSVASAWWLVQTGGLLRSATAVATAWDSSTVRAQDERELLSHVACLVLDDVGTEVDRYAGAMGAALRELLEVRQGARTIITTNLTAERWARRYPDDRLASRMARAYRATCVGEDLRRSR